MKKFFTLLFGLFTITVYAQDHTVNGRLIGGLGAATTSGTLDWNHLTNARSGSGYTLLRGSALNGMGGNIYYHPLSFEYNSKNGNGNLTQLAIPYTNGGSIFFRERYSGSWASWKQVLDNQNYASILDTRYVQLGGTTTAFSITTDNDSPLQLTSTDDWSGISFTDPGATGELTFYGQSNYFQMRSRLELKDQLHIYNGLSGNTVLSVAGASNTLLDLYNDSDRGRLRIYRAGGTGYGQLFHNGTNFTLSTNAGVVEIQDNTLVNGQVYGGFGGIVIVGDLGYI